MLSFQNIVLLHPNPTFSFRAYHVFVALATLAVVILSPSIKVLFSPSGIVFVLFFFMELMSSIVAYFSLGFDPSILRYFIYGYLVLLGAFFGGLLGKRWIRIVFALRLAQMTIAFVVLAKTLFLHERILDFLKNPQGHPDIPTLFIGGPNLEATWLALGAVFFFGTKWFVPVWVLALVISLLYASRAAFLAVVAVLLLYVYYSGRRRFSYVALIALLGSGTVVILIGVLWLVSAFGEQVPYLYLFERFSGVGQDPGSIGRIRLYEGATRALFRNPLGYGVGHSMSVVRELTGHEFFEDNIHNIYLQIALDGGVQSLVVYILMVASIISEAARSRNVLGVYLIMYFLLGLIQFSGYDYIPAFIMGLYFSSRQRNGSFESREVGGCRK